tara:strand:+ start:2284 stop:2610 length:327 start_codon:yes stop_codon:yes gene_type:complete
MELLSVYHVVVYVPEDALEDFIQKISPHIPSFLGHYDHVCWWSEAGNEQYRNKDGGDIKRNASHRVALYLPQDDALLRRFINEIVIENHPWVEPVITVSIQKIVNHAK